MIEKLARRGFLGFVLGGAAGAAVTPPSVGIKAAAAALGVSTAQSAIEIGEAATGIGLVADDDWMLINRIESIHYSRQKPERHMPPHIASMRSWSPVYKAMIAGREDAIMQTYLEKLRQDKTFMDRVKSTFFGVRDDNP